MKRFLPAALLFLSCACGCTDSKELSSPTAQRLNGLTTAYLDYAVAKGMGPRNESELLRHLANLPAIVLEQSQLNAKAGRECLVSLRDGKPFVFLYGAPLQGIGTKNPAVIAYEQAGLHGSRLVAFANGELKCVDEKTCGELLMK